MESTVRTRGVAGILRDIVGGLELRRYVEIVQALAARNIKTRYRGSILGIYWSLSNPLFMTLVYSAIFGSAFASHYNNSIFGYAISCFCGLSLLSFFSQATSQALPSIVGNGALLNKLRLPVSVFPVSIVVANVFQLLVGIQPFLAIVTLVFSHSLINVVALAVPMLSLVMVAMAFAFITSALYVFFRDLQYIYELFMFVLFLTSPIFYPIELVPPAVRKFVELNPLSTMVSSVRDIAISGGPPHLHLMALSLMSGMISLIAGVALFLFVKNEFMDLL
jgi:ABC-type polysaccharide/polyol phosphate export permease